MNPIHEERSMHPRRLRVSTQLTLGFGAMTALIAVTGFVGIRNGTQAAEYLREVTVRDAKDEIDITRIRSLMEVDRSQVLQALQHNPEVEYSKWHDHPTAIHFKVAAETSESLRRLWAQYESGIHTPEEKRLAADWHARSGGLGLDNVAKAMAAIQAGQWSVAQATLIKDINPAFRDGDVALQSLDEFFRQRKVADAAIVNDGLDRNRATMIGLLATSLLMAATIVFLMVRRFRRELGGEPSHARSIANGVAQGDLSQEIPLRADDRESVLFAMSAMQASLTQLADRVRQGSESVSIASSEIARGNQDLSARTESQAAAVEETVASMEELSSTVRQNADNARLANQMAQGASRVAEQGGAAMSRVVDTMQGISDGARRISSIIGVIDRIAFQTNILALNAAVEAARAGDQGRGFAVVAAEVRTLAGHSAQAANEIKDLIGASVTQVEQGTAFVAQAGATMDEVVVAIRRVTDIVGEISVACTEQSTGVAQVGEAMGQIDRVTQGNAALVQEMAVAAASLMDQSQRLVQAVAIFRLGALRPAPERDDAPPVPGPAGARAEPVAEAGAEAVDVE
jgi:methyl-accepting chemotaxis protein/methyl-accepting chemotaxis protein-1 (serine sensor receptor)